MTRSTTLALFAALIALPLSAPAQAGDWIDARRGETWTTTNHVDPASIAGRVPGFRSADSVRIEAAAGGWRLWSDFVGLGRQWVHAENGARVYLWDGVAPRLLLDFDRPGYKGLQAIRLTAGLLESYVAQVGETLETPLGAQRCSVAYLTYKPDKGGVNAIQRRKLYVAKGAGIVRWDDELDNYAYGLAYQRANVVHQREAPAPGFQRLAIQGAQNAIRVGNRAFVAAGDRLVVVDLAAGRVLSTLRTPASRISRAGDLCVVSGMDLQRRVNVSHRLNLQTLALTPIAGVQATPLAISRPAPFVAGTAWGNRQSLIADAGSSLRILTEKDQLDQSHTLQPILAYGNFGYDDDSDRGLYLPAAYPGGVFVVDTRSKTVARLDTQDWNHDVKLVGHHLFVAGDFFGLQRFEWHARGQAQGTSILSEPVGRLYSEGQRLYAVVSSGLVELDAEGKELGRTPVAGLSTRTPASVLELTQHSVLDVQGRSALVLVGGEGLRVVTLR